MKPQSCVNILAVLNAMIARVSSSLPEIDDATRGLFGEQATPGASGVEYSSGKVGD